MVRAELTVLFPEGIHLVPANKIANIAEKFESKIYFKSDYMTINAKSVISLVSGAFRKGDKVLCVCEGSDEKDALEALKTVFSQA